MRIHVSDFAKHRGLSGVQVTLNGEDVSKICFEADDGEGWVKVYLLKDEKRCYDVATDGFSWEKREGEVKIFLPPFK